MPALTFLVTWMGYSLFAYGFSQLRGCNASWKEISWPGKFQGCKPDPKTTTGYQQGTVVGSGGTGGAVFVPAPGGGYQIRPSNKPVGTP